MPRLPTRTIGSWTGLGDANATEIFREDVLPDTFDFSTIPGAVFGQVTLPKRMPTPLKVRTIGDIEQIKADGVAAYALIVYVLDGNQWRLRHRSERNFSLGFDSSRPDVMLSCSLDLGITRDSPLSDRTITAILQVIGGTMDVSVEVESG